MRYFLGPLRPRFLDELVSWSLGEAAAIIVGLQEEDALLEDGYRIEELQVGYLDRALLVYPFHSRVCV